MTVKRQSRSACLFALIMTPLLPVAANDALITIKEEVLFVKGKVIDQQNHPIAHAHILLKDKQHGTRLTAQSRGNGEFELKHKPTTSESLQVSPPKSSGLAQALMDNVAGDQTRHIIVQLHPGFLVKGRVIENGKGLKGVRVRATPAGNGQKDVDPVHGGGWTITDKNGLFTLNLTPGKKKIELESDSKLRFENPYIQDVSVTGDMTVPDFTLVTK